MMRLLACKLSLGTQMSFDLVLLGLAITLDPMPLVGYVLLLGSRGGTAKGFGFAVGWVLCLVILVGSGAATVAQADLSKPSALASVIAFDCWRA
jgi:hypothetical protein